MRDIPALLRSIRHTRASQLAHRVRLTAKRRLLGGRPALGRILDGTGDRPPPALSTEPPVPLLPPRGHAADRADGGWRARFLGREFAIEPPVRWRDPERTHLEILTLHYMEYLEAVDDEAFRALVLDWIEHNPPHRTGYAAIDWNAFSLSIRIVVWMQQMVTRGLPTGDAFGRRAVASIARQARFLARNLELDIVGNHLIKNIKGLLWAAAFFDGEEPSRWGRAGIRLLRRETAEQILHDGMHFERSPAYHAQVHADLLDCRVALPPGKDRDALDRTLERSAQALADLVHPDGDPALFNDGGRTMAYPVTACLETQRILLGAAPGPRTHVRLEDAGYFGVRSGKDLVLVDCGPIAPDHLPAHGHGDMLGFEWTVGGRRVVVDTGVFEYRAGPDRERSRATAAHNTVTVDDADQCEFWSSFRVGRRVRPVLDAYRDTPDGFVLDGHHRGFSRLEGGPIHRRRFECTPRRLEVRDRVEGGAGQAVRARLLFAPGATRRPCENGIVLHWPDGPAVRLLTDADVRFEDREWFPDFGVRIPTVQAVLEYGPAPTTGGFVLEADPS